MPYTVPLVSDEHAQLVGWLRFTVEATATVDDYCTDYLVSGEATIDSDVLLRERVENVLRTLSELDEIVSHTRDITQLEVLTPEARLLAETVRRAGALALAIREGLALVAEPRRVMSPSDVARYRGGLMYKAVEE